MGELEKLERLLIENGNRYYMWKLEGRIISIIVKINSHKLVASDLYKRKTYVDVPFNFVMTSKIIKNEKKRITREKQQLMYADEFMEIITELEKINNEEK